MKNNELKNTFAELERCNTYVKAGANISEKEIADAISVALREDFPDIDEIPDLKWYEKLWCDITLTVEYWTEFLKVLFCSFFSKNNLK